MIRARIVVKGEVQKVGFRDFVEKVARKLSVKGYVENLRDGNVQIVCEAQEAVLNGFVEGINVKDDFIKVEKVRVVERSEATGEFDFFEIKYGRLEEELGERLGTAVAYAGATRQDIKEMHMDLKGSIEGMHMDLKGSIKEMHKDLKEDTTAIKEGIGEMHKDLRDELVGVRGEVRDMHVDMGKSFEEMAKRYDVISAELVRTREELTKAVNALLKLIEKFIHEGRGT